MVPRVGRIFSSRPPGDRGTTRSARPLGVFHEFDPDDGVPAFDQVPGLQLGGRDLLTVDERFRWCCSGP